MPEQLARRGRGQQLRYRMVPARECLAQRGQLGRRRPGGCPGGPAGRIPVHAPVAHGGKTEAASVTECLADLVGHRDVGGGYDGTPGNLTGAANTCRRGETATYQAADAVGGD